MFFIAGQRDIQILDMILYKRHQIDHESIKLNNIFFVFLIFAVKLSHFSTSESNAIIVITMVINGINVSFIKKNVWLY
jgi:hypothetical protein